VDLSNISVSLDDHFALMLCQRDSSFQ